MDGSLSVPRADHEPDLWNEQWSSALAAMRDVSHEEPLLVRALIATPQGKDLARYCPVQRAMANVHPAAWERVNVLAAQSSTSPERQPTFWIEAANGGRRVPGYDPAQIGAYLESARILTDGLPEDPRRERLAELLDVHGSVVFADSGGFAKAIACQERIAARTTVPVSRAYALYMAAWLRAMMEVRYDVEARTLRLSSDFVEAFVDAGRMLIHASSGTDDGLRYEGNFFANKFLIRWLGGGEDRRVNVARLEALVAISGTLQSALGDGLRLVHLFQDVARGESSAYLNMTRFGEDESVSPDWRYWGTLSAALIDLYELRPAAFDLLRSLASMRGPGGHTPRRLAKEILAAVASGE